MRQSPPHGAEVVCVPAVLSVFVREWVVDPRGVHFIVVCLGQGGEASVEVRGDACHFMNPYVIPQNSIEGLLQLATSYASVCVEVGNLPGLKGPKHQTFRATLDSTTVGPCISDVTTLIPCMLSIFVWVSMLVLVVSTGEHAHVCGRGGVLACVDVGANERVRIRV